MYQRALIIFAKDKDQRENRTFSVVRQVLGGNVPSYTIIVREHFWPREAGARTGTVLMFTLLGMAPGG